MNRSPLSLVLIVLAVACSGSFSAKDDEPGASGTGGGAARGGAGPKGGSGGSSKGGASGAGALAGNTGETGGTGGAAATGGTTNGMGGSSATGGSNPTGAGGSGGTTGGSSSGGDAGDNGSGAEGGTGGTGNAAGNGGSGNQSNQGGSAGTVVVTGGVGGVIGMGGVAGVINVAGAGGTNNAGSGGTGTAGSGGSGGEVIGGCGNQLLANAAFDSGRTGVWTEESTYAGVEILTRRDDAQLVAAGVTPHTGDWLAWLGGIPDNDEERKHTVKLRQTIAVPADAASLTVSGRYWIKTAENPNDAVYDELFIEIEEQEDVVVQLLHMVSNLDDTTGWTSFERSTDNLDQIRGRTLTFRAYSRTDFTYQTSFYLDSLRLVANCGR